METNYQNQFRVALRTNCHEEAKNIFVDFLNTHTEDENLTENRDLFETFCNGSISPWLESHGMLNHIHFATLRALQFWWIHGECLASTNDSWPLACLTRILILEPNCQIYPGPRFPPPDRNLQNLIHKTLDTPKTEGLYYPFKYQEQWKTTCYDQLF